MRVGIGQQAHGFGPGRVLVVGGVKIPGTWGLRGPGDADVLLRACSDALLGGAGLGDLEDHFPAEDPDWADAPSAVLLAECAVKLAALGLRVVHVDAVLTAVRVDLRPHRRAMRTRLASVLGIEERAVNVKCAPHGATLAGEGIAAQVAATLAEESA